MKNAMTKISSNLWGLRQRVIWYISFYFIINIYHFIFFKLRFYRGRKEYIDKFF